VSALQVEIVPLLDVHQLLIFVGTLTYSETKLIKMLIVDIAPVCVCVYHQIMVCPFALI
jgi:hypothetical protein